MRIERKIYPWYDTGGKQSSITYNPLEDFLIGSTLLVLNNYLILFNKEDIFSSLNLSYMILNKVKYFAIYFQKIEG